MAREIVLTLMLLALFSGDCVFGGSVRDSNNYMDHVDNDYLKSALRSDDPKTLPSFNTQFKTSFTRVTVTANYSRCAMNGLTSVKRLVDCKPSYWLNNNATLNCTLTFDRLDVKCDLRGKYGILPTSNAIAKARITNTNIFVEVTSYQQRNFPNLRQFHVNSVGKVNPSFDSLGTLSPASDSLGKTFGGNITFYVLNVMNNEFRTKLAESVSKLTMPFP